jgi:signal transduction histidine kinase
VTGYLVTEGPQSLLPWSPVFSAQAAACVIGRTSAPGAASAGCAAVWVAGWLAGYPVLGGFWCFGTLGCLLWAVAAHAPVVSRDLLGGVLLVGAVAWTMHRADPDNLAMLLMLMSVAASGGIVVRLARGREINARSSAMARAAELLTATREAVSAERAGFARDLHDVVSHAVGLIAMQSSAAQVSWPHNPGEVRRSVAVIEATARSTLAELDQLKLESHGHEADMDDLVALVERIRSTGTCVDLTVVGEFPARCGSVIHRVLQESLTNAVRHSPGAAVRATVSSTKQQVVVRVIDDGVGPGASAARGYGLVGLTERGGLAGGTLTTGAGPEGGFIVEATLPTANDVMLS